MAVTDDGLVERVRNAIIAAIDLQTGGRWPVDDLVDAELDFDELARAALAASDRDVLVRIARVRQAALEQIRDLVSKRQLPLTNEIYEIADAALIPLAGEL